MLKIKASTHPSDLILAAKEARWQWRLATGKPFITLTLNIPALPKTSPLIASVFQEVSQEILYFFRTFFPIPTSLQPQLDAAGHYLFIPCPPEQTLPILKTAAEKMEATHPLGRLLDLDVYDASGLPLPGTKRQRPCLLCSEPARHCIKQQKHTPTALRAAVEQQLAAFPPANLPGTDRLADLAVQALLTEVAIHPKPGLVTRITNGPHQDMNYFTFLASAFSLRSGFQELATLGATANCDWPWQFRRLRGVGLQMEEAMQRATGGRNTHKGAIFLLGLTVWAAAYTTSHQQSYRQLPNLLRLLTAGICAELQKPDLATHGAKIYRQFGLTGARGAAEAGLPLVFQTALPLARRLSKRGWSEDQLWSAVLTALIRQNNDTNLVYRGDLAKLQKVQSLATRICQAGFWTPAAQRQYLALERYCLRHGLSCGGSADLLAITIFVHALSFRL